MSSIPGSLAGAVDTISVIIVSYRTPTLLRRCLEILCSQATRRRIEVVVVDNGSGDESPQVASSFPEVRLIQSRANLGFAAGVNLGLQAASGSYFMIMNPDVEMHPGVLDHLAEFLDSHPSTGIAAPKLLNPSGSVQPSCRRRYTLASILLRRTVLGRLFPNARALRHHLMLDYDHSTARAVDWVTGAAMMVRRQAVEDVGYLDEKYFLYFEDVDWCARMKARGWLVHYWPECVVTHHWQRASFGFRLTTLSHLRSGLRFFARWGFRAPFADAPQQKSAESDARFSKEPMLSPSSSGSE